MGNVSCITVYIVSFRLRLIWIKSFRHVNEAVLIRLKLDNSDLGPSNILQRVQALGNLLAKKSTTNVSGGKDHLEPSSSKSEHWTSIVDEPLPENDSVRVFPGMKVKKYESQEIQFRIAKEVKA